jgi:formate hydrogenlyase subunit 3/multisubunit Na+/H+ antiporter MnhD subunit
MSLALIRQRTSTDRFAALKGVARKVPIAALGLALGGLALAGFPLTASFATRWGISRAVLNMTQPLESAAQGGITMSFDLASGEPWMWPLALAGLLASSVGIIIGLLRGLGSMVGTATRDDGTRQPFLASLMIMAVSALAFLIAFFPQLFLEPVLAVVSSLGLF